jgi:hypothetical protein
MIDVCGILSLEKPPRALTAIYHNHSTTMISPEQSSPSPQVSRLRSFFKIGTLILLSLGAIFLFVDWRAGSHYTRPWLQVCFAIVGVLVIGRAVFVPKLSRARRVILGADGSFIILAVLDSLDGQQDILTSIVVILFLWASVFADASLQLLQPAATTLRRRVATSIALLATLTYLASACYYAFINLTVAPQSVDRDALFGVALLLNLLIRWIGELTPKPAPLTGTIRVCPACGLRNIPERQTCNRCGARLGSIEHVI